MKLAMRILSLALLAMPGVTAADGTVRALVDRQVSFADLGSPFDGTEKSQLILMIPIVGSET
jgi:hypothetical protein